MSITFDNDQNQVYPFSTIIPVRITDINYGKHLGHMATIGILHNARVLFLSENNFDELNIDGLGIILLNSYYSFKKEAFFNSKLVVKVGIGEYTKLKINFLYKIIEKDTENEIMNGKEEVAFFDYSKGKISRIPQIFMEFCRSMQVTNINLTVQN